MDFLNLVDILNCRSQYQADKTAFTFLRDGETEAGTLSYQELDRLARAIAAFLQSKNVTGQRALLLYPPGLEFISAFCGCLYAGVIAIPVPPPSAASLKRTLPRLFAIAKDAQASFALTTSGIISLLGDSRKQISEFPAMVWLASEDIPCQLANQWQKPTVSGDSLAYLQYTSGSTGTPKGVMVSHRNLIQNSADINQVWGYTSDSIATTWMPYFHDYGLVDGLIQPIYAGIPCYIMSSLAFIKRPIRWLQIVSQYKVTHSQGPNFAYDYCIRKITPEQCATLDLSSWRTASNGAEPIRKNTLENFVKIFAPSGFRAEAFYPSYGLAEATLLVSTKRQDQKPLSLTLEASALAKNRVVPVSQKQSGTHTVVSCGVPIGRMKVVIANSETLTQCAPHEVGEIWVSDPSVAQGYWQKSEETERTFQAYLADTGEGPFLRTGDLGFMKDGELFVTGRLKDIIIMRGRNYYPQDIELTLEHSYPGIRPHCCAAFSVDVVGEERLVVAAEINRQKRNLDREYNRAKYHESKCLNFQEVVAAIRRKVLEQHELQIYAVLLLKSGSIPKTSSGKIQRRACRTGFVDKNLDIVYEWIDPPPDRNSSIPSNRGSFDKQFAVEPQMWQIGSQDSASQKTQAIQSWLISKFSQEFRIESNQIDIRENLLDYGLDSVQAVTAVFELEELLGQQIHPTLLYDRPTIASLTQYLVERVNVSQSNGGVTQIELREVELNGEAVLDEAIYSNVCSLQLIGEPEAILLTGATGFLGAFLLQELLEQTQANVYCLVRAVDPVSGKMRIQKNLQSYHIWNDNFSARIIPVVGDISQHQLGLSGEEWQKIASKIDIIYHSAAKLNWIAPYSALKAINVLGTQEILRLASYLKIKPVHYVSTVAVCESSGYYAQEISESDRVTQSQDIYLGYSQSKWVSEQLVKIASDRGIPICIYRPAFISGHSQTGAWQTDDIVCRLIKGSIQMESMLSWNFAQDMSPVDYVSRAIVYLSQQQQSIGKTFHLHNPHPMNWNNLMEWINSFGYLMKRVTYEEWEAKIKNTSNKENHLYPLIPFFTKRYFENKLTILQVYEEGRRPKLGLDKTLDALANTSIRCPPVDEKLLETYFSYFISNGFLNQPQV